MQNDWLPELIVASKRECGRRKSGGCYLVSEGSPDGTLPMWVDIDPPIPYPGPESRMYMLLDLNEVLRGVPYPEYLRGESEERILKSVQREKALGLFGMPLGTRRMVGEVGHRGGDIQVLGTLVLADRRDFGFSLRSLAQIKLGRKSTPEIPEIVRHAQDGQWMFCLAATWRLWRNAAPGARLEAAPFVQVIMRCLGAPLDAKEVQA